ncbi:3-ketosteroid reductase [Penicillium alfredii]|uniref:3beta-hydroxysteroid 3-dehydrogenase n=1 Tax=Penicillium alfredii TaxID=1506179 RepID=A0A9W9JYZ4_9EURO|nr:3-ketosteroid reductase [Penicillium alfredii]KAJ5086566.1 3-ketosteroid reductase [Penicillium alfredii]
MGENDTREIHENLYILVTGANSGLGFSICCRLADEFLSTHPDSQSLTIIFTTRSSRKAEDTRRRLEKYLRSSSTPSAAERVQFVSENVDLTDLHSVRLLSRRLVQTLPKLDAIVLNAGIGGWSGIDWPNAIWGVCTDLLHQVTWPPYKLAPVGVLTNKQTEGPEEPLLGYVFCANVFGHYMLAHNVAPLLQRAQTPNGPGRVIWVSSIEATTKLFHVDDLQGLRTAAPYESSKALTDILALTSDLPGTAPWAVDSFLRGDFESNPDTNGTSAAPKPTMYLSHPGVCATTIIPLALPLVYAMLIAFWGARMLGSPWHTLSTYLGACAPVFLALSGQAALDAAEKPYHQAGGGRAKWGSSSSRLGVESVACTEIDGWGYGGVVGRPVVEADRCRRRKRGAVDLTREERENFEELGRKCWKQMEELRIQWDEILDRAEKAKTSDQ